MALSLCLQAMESKLLVGGKTIIDHTNEQQKMLELKRQEIAEQVCEKQLRESLELIFQSEHGPVSEFVSSVLHACR